MTGIPLYDLKPGQCHFPVTPDEATKHLFCAEPVEADGCPYCPEHAARCFDRRSLTARRAANELAKEMRAAEQASRRSTRPRY